MLVVVIVLWVCMPVVVVCILFLKHLKIRVNENIEMQSIV